ncbi:MAG: hypothetical protein ABJH82_01415 [Polaribacter sp.]|uniref:tetratricopeptide repeat protein n=1 Tax=Polaribacter sp. TaxID=1920175 RepID=UPI00326678F5
MLHKPYKNKINAIDTLYRNTINKTRKDSLYILNYTSTIKKWALSNSDKELALEADLLKAYTNWFIYGSKKPQLINQLKEIAEKGHKNKIYHIEQRAIKVIITHFWKIKNFEKSFEWILKSAKILEKLQPQEFPNMAEHLNYIGRCYYHFQDYKNAIIYYTKAAKLNRTFFNAKAVIEAQSTIGLCYQKLGKLNIAESYFLKVIKDTTKYKNKIWHEITSGNLGYNYYLQKKYKEAIPLLKKDIKSAIAINDPGLAAGSAIPLANIYLKQERLTEAKIKIKEARKYIKQSQQTDRLRLLYPIISKWYAANMEAKLSASYLDSSISAINTYNKKYSSLKLLRANQKAEAKEKELEIAELQSKNKLKLTIRNFIILLITFLLIISILIYKNRNKYLLKEKQVKDLELINTQKALENAKHKLNNLTLKVRRDSNLLIELQKEKNYKNDIDLINELKNKNILTLNDWKQFQNLFKKVHPNFITSITTEYNNLSQAEIRCLCLEKLELTNNEMGLILGISKNTIRVTKHRIRKKLGIINQEELEKIVKATYS